MFCRKCGKEIPDDSVFCPKCGFNLGDVSGSVQAGSAQSVQPVKSFDQGTQARIDQLHKEVSAAFNPSGYNGNALVDVTDQCRELKRYDDTDFVANNYLVEYYCLKLEPEDYRRQFESVLECIKFALAGSSPNERTARAEGYYKKLLKAIERNISELQAEFESKPISDLFGFNPRRKFAKQNASRDVLIFLSVIELTRIPYLSDGFLDTEIEYILKRYEIGDSYQICVMGYSKAISGGTFKMRYFRELVKNYPEYSNRSAKAKEYLDEKLDKNHTFRDIINVKFR